MRGTWVRISMMLALLVGCGGGSKGGAVDAHLDGDGAIIVIDSAPGAADARIDGGPAAGVVACGTLQAPTTCTLPGQACCDFTFTTGTDVCYDVAGGTCKGGTPMTCDGSEDCGAGERCCYKSGVGSSCTAGPDCAPGGSGGQIMCHLGDNAACAPNGVCCELRGGGPSTGSPFGVCRTGACPA
jgi:hypothetical protein